MVDKGSHFISGSSRIPIKTSVVTFYRRQWLFVVGGMSLQSRGLYSWRWWDPMISGRLLDKRVILHAWAFARCSFAAAAGHWLFSVWSAWRRGRRSPSPARPTDSAGSLIILLFRAGDTWPSNKSPRSFLKMEASSYAASVQTLLPVETFSC